MHAVLALGTDEAGDKQHYVSITDKEINEIKVIDTNDNNKECSVDNSKENLDTMLELLEEHDEMKDEIKDLCSQFVEQRIQRLDAQYLTGIKKFFQVYLSTVHSL